MSTGEMTGCSSCSPVYIHISINNPLPGSSLPKSHTLIKTNLHFDYILTIVVGFLFIVALCLLSGIFQVMNECSAVYDYCIRGSDQWKLSSYCELFRHTEGISLSTTH